MGRLPWVILALALVSSTASAQQLSQRCELALSFEEGLSAARGTLSCELTAGARIGGLVAWLYPNALSRRPASLDDVSFEWYYPGAFDPGSLTVESAELDGRAVTPAPWSAPQVPEGGALRLPIALDEGQRATVRLSFRTRIPRRFGPFGVHQGQATLLAPVHPFLLAEGVERLPQPAEWRVTLQLPKEGFALVGGERYVGAPVSLHDREFVDLVVRESPLSEIGRPPLWATPAEFRAGTDAFLGRPTRDLGRERIPSEVQRRLADGLAFLKRLVPSAVIPTLVEAPLRDLIAVAGPGMVAISERSFKVTPLKQIYRLQHEAVLRRVFATALLPHARRRERPEDAPLVADMIASVLAHRYAEERYGKTRDVKELINGFDFVEDIEIFLRAPKSPMVGVYFRAAWDPLLVRDEPFSWNNDRPRGRVALEKASDSIGAEGIDRAVMRWLAESEEGSLRGLLVEQGGARVGEIFDTWSKGTPRVSYLLEEATETASAQGYQYQAKLSVVGDQPPEDLTVDFRDREGGHHLVKVAAGGASTLQASAKGPARLKLTQVDPGARLVETAPAGDAHDLEADNRLPRELAVVVTHFLPAFSAADGSFSLDTGLQARFRDDPQNRVQLSGVWSSAYASAVLTLRHSFGPKLEPGRLSASAGMTMTLLSLRPGFLTGAPGTAACLDPFTSGCFAAGPGIFVSTDNRISAIDPEVGHAGVAAARVVFSASGPVLAASLRGVQLVPLATGHTLALRARLIRVAGPSPVQLLAQLGGEENVRGFGASEVLSKGVALASVEWRHTLAGDLDVDLFLLYRLRKIRGALFADAALADHLSTPGAPRAALFGDVGYGVQLFADLAGVRPSLLSFQVALPLGRLASSRSRPPFGFYVTLTPSFFSP